MESYKLQKTEELLLANMIYHYRYCPGSKTKFIFYLSCTDLVERKTFKYQLSNDQITQIMVRADEKRFEEILSSQWIFSTYNFFVQEESKDLFFKDEKIAKCQEALPIESVSLDKQEMIALSAFKIIKEIIEVSPNYIFAKVQHKSIRDYLMNVCTINNKHFGAIEDLFVVNPNIRTVKRTKNVYNYQRHTVASVNQEIYYNPTRITFELINKILIKAKSGNIFIIGKGGIGKSMSLFFICDLLKIIEQFKIQKNLYSKSSEQIKTIMRLLGYSQLITKDLSFLRLPKLFYVDFSSNFNAQIVITLILKQQTQKIKVSPHRFSSFYQLFLYLKEFYDKYSIPIIFIVDQVNAYTSEIRKYAQKQINNHQSIRSMTKFIRDASSCGMKMVYCSSPNFQKDILNNQSPDVENIFHNNKSTVEYILNYQKNDNNIAAIDIIYAIVFEIEMKIYSGQIVNKKLVNELKRRKEKLLETQYLQDIYSNNIQTNHLCIMTHQTINKFFNIQDLHMLKFLTCQMDQIESQFCALLYDIQGFYFSKLGKHFQQYVNKGNFDQNNAKMKIILLLRATARKIIRQESQNQLIPLFQSKFAKKVFDQYSNFDLSDKTHTFVQRESSTITVYLDPSIFLSATKNIQLREGASKFYKDFITNLQQNPSHFGGHVEEKAIKILAQSQSYKSIKLTLDNRQYYIIKNNYTFQHFQPKMKDLDPIKKLRKLMRIVKEMKISFENYICAYPICKNKTKDQGEIRSVNSWVIDTLLLNWISDEMYNIVSIDFTVTKKVDKIRQKVNNAKSLFAKIAKKLVPNSIHHIIVAPMRVIIEYFKLQNKSQSMQFSSRLYQRINRQAIIYQQISRIRLSLFPLQDFNIEFIQEITQSMHDKVQYIQLWNLLRENNRQYLNSQQ